jgi:PIN domain nuclease of toxin-antitoxin system
MKLLLDTHTLLWWLDGGEKLSARARELISDSENIVYVSVVSAWEIVVKKVIGKLDAPKNLEEEVVRHEFEKLAITFPHVTELQELPPIHRDPFDRMLVAQARVEACAIITKDPIIPKYDIGTIEA